MVVDRDIAKRSHFSPWDLGMLLAKLRSDLTGGLADDLQPPAYCVEEYLPGDWRPAAQGGIAQGSCAHPGYA